MKYLTKPFLGGALGLAGIAVLAGVALANGGDEPAEQDDPVSPAAGMCAITHADCMDTDFSDDASVPQGVTVGEPNEAAPGVDEPARSS